MAELRLPDLILLKAIVQAETPPTKAMLWIPHGGQWNIELRTFVRSGKCAPVNSDSRFAQAIKALREAGLLELKPPYRPTPLGTGVIEECVANKRWPLVLPIVGDDLDWLNAAY